MSVKDYWSALTPEERETVLSMYDESERARVYAEWCTDGRSEHDCDPLDTYSGGCAVCGLPLATT
jgi:hypothetical protein